MKRFRTLFLGLALTTVLAGNIFATESIVSAASLSTTLFSSAVNAVLSLLGDNDSCPVRQCTDCRPDGNGHCRPGSN